MITFKTFLTEETRDLIEYLRTYCQPAISDFLNAKNYLWRGMNPKGPRDKWEYDKAIIDGYFGQRRENRRPRDTPPWAHELIDEFFEVEFDMKLRSSTVFAFNNRSKAGGYGSTFAMIPVGKYTIYWSPKVEDLTSELFPDLESGVDDGLAGGRAYWDEELGDAHARITRQQEIHFINEYLQQADYKRGPNVEALKHAPGELMVWCSHYLALQISESEMTEVLLEAATDEKVEQ